MTIELVTSWYQIYNEQMLQQVSYIVITLFLFHHSCTIIH